MDKLRAITTLKTQVEDEVRRLESSIQTTRQKLAALETVEQMLQDAQERTAPIAAPVSVEPQVYKGSKHDEALRDVLGKAGRKLTASEAAEILKRGGARFTGKNPAHSVYATLQKNVKGLYVTEKMGARTYFGLAEDAAP